MGRAKLKMELISKEKSRITAYEKRKKGIIKKAAELSILCGVKTCMIIYGPKKDGGHIELETWPPNPDDVNRVIEMYKGKPVGECGKRVMDLSLLLESRNKKVENEMVKTKNNNIEKRYGKWNEGFQGLSIDEIKIFIGKLDYKIEDVKKKLLMFYYMKEEAELLALGDNNQMGHNYFSNSYGGNPMDMQIGFNPNYYGRDYISQFGVGCSNNIQFFEPNNQIYCDTNVLQYLAMSNNAMSSNVTKAQVLWGNEISVTQSFGVVDNGVTEMQGAWGNNLYGVTNLR